MNLIEIITIHKGAVSVLEQGTMELEFAGYVQEYLDDPSCRQLDTSIVVETYIIQSENILTIEILKRK